MASSINLERFRASTQRFLQNNASRWAPLYSISGQHNSNVSSLLTGQSSFTLNTQNGLPNLAVNQSTDHTKGLLGNTQYLNFNPTHPGAVQVSSLDNANTNVRPFGFDPSSGALPALLIGGGSTPTTAPTLDADTATLTDRYAISEGNLSSLIASGEFDLPSIGLGLRVTTDGVNVTDVDVHPSAQALQARDRALVSDVNTAGIIYPNNPVNGSGGPNTPTQPGDLSPLIGNNKAAGSNNPFAATKISQNPFKVLTPGLIDSGQPLNPNSLNSLNQTSNPLTQLALGIQPEQGLTVIGGNAEANATTTRHIASVQAKLDVNVSLAAQQHIGKLQELAAQQLAIAAQGLPLPAERNGIIPLVTPHIYQPPAGSDLISSTDQQATMNLSTDMSDKSQSNAGLMLGLMMGSSGEQGAGAGTGGSGENPNKKQQRKPLRIIA